MKPDSLAIVDLGTNTFNMLLVVVDERDQFVVQGKFKEMVKLGEGGINAGVIGDAAFERGIRTLKTFRKLIDSNGIVKVLAFATSAIRSASNGGEFIATAKKEADINIKIINGNEEASLIHEGVKNGIQLPRDRAVLLLDIGGGSVEFIVSENGTPLLLRSLNIGAARLLEKIAPSDPILPEEMQQVMELLDKHMGGLVEELKEFDIELLVGSSGTFETLATLIAFHNKDFLSAQNLNGYRFARAPFQLIFDQLVSKTVAERSQMPGMDPLRVEMIPFGAALVSYLVNALDINAFVVSEFALKEGILYRHLKEKKKRMAQYMGAAERSLRAKAVQNLARKYDFDQKHGIQVSELATSLFQQLSPLHEEGEIDLEMLQYACVLHDIGRFVHPSGHHKHGQYIIMNSSLSGFSTNELVLLANLVRYHRKTLPRRDHFHFRILPEKRKKLVEYLGGILRLADNLDRGHRNLVTGLTVDLSQPLIRIKVKADDDVEMEVDHAMENRELLEVALGRSVLVTQGY